MKLKKVKNEIEIYTTLRTIARKAYAIDPAHHTSNSIFLKFLSEKSTWRNTKINTTS